MIYHHSSVRTSCKPATAGWQLQARTVGVRRVRRDSISFARTGCNSSWHEFWISTNRLARVSCRQKHSCASESTVQNDCKRHAKLIFAVAAGTEVLTAAPIWLYTT
eukprot:286382-Pleurochrysis_carterae.AAC.1